MCAEDAIDVETDRQAAQLFQQVLEKKKHEPPVPENEEEQRTRLGGLVRERLVTLASDGSQEGAEESTSMMASEVLKGLEEGQILFGTKPRVERADHIHVWKKTLRIKQQRNTDQQEVNLAMVGLTVRDDQDPAQMKQFFTPEIVKKLYEFYANTPLDATRFTTAMLVNITLKEPGIGEFPKLGA